MAEWEGVAGSGVATGIVASHNHLANVSEETINRIFPPIPGPEPILETFTREYLAAAVPNRIKITTKIKLPRSEYYIGKLPLRKLVLFVCFLFLLTLNTC